MFRPSAPLIARVFSGTASGAVFTLLVSSSLALILAGCGDDDAPSDAGPSANGHDASTRDGGSASHPDRDAGAVVSIDEDAGALPPLASCPPGECDLTDPDACGADRGCILPHGDLDAAAGPQCAMVGSSGDGEPCEHSSDCSFGLDCSAFDGTGVCRQYCCNLTRIEGCPDGQFCRIGLGSTSAPSGAALCDKCDGCDPNKNSCGKGLACYPLPGAPQCTACLPAGTHKPGSTCTVTTECAADSACFRLADKSSRCIQFCNLMTDPTCPSTKKCTAPGTKLPGNLGLCL